MIVHHWGRSIHYVIILLGGWFKSTYRFHVKIPYPLLFTLGHKLERSMTGYMDGQLGGHTLTTVTFRSDILCITVASCYNIIMNLHQRHLLTDHPWVIKKNETCVLTADDKSCRNHTCYTGLLFDLLDKIDAELKNLDDCTLTVVEAVGTYLNTTESEGTWIGGGGLMEIMEKHVSHF